MQKHKLIQTNLFQTNIKRKKREFLPLSFYYDLGINSKERWSKRGLSYAINGLKEIDVCLDAIDGKEHEDDGDDRETETYAHLE